MVIVAAMFGVVAVAVQEPVVIGLRTAAAANQREDVRLQMSRALELLTREAAAAYNVDNSTSTQFQFDARLTDADADGDAETLTDINWRVNNGDLERVQGGTTMVVVPDLTTVAFTYLDSSNNSTNTAANVRVMQMTMTATRNNEAISMATSVRPRNQ